MIEGFHEAASCQRYARDFGPILLSSPSAYFREICLKQCDPLLGMADLRCYRPATPRGDNVFAIADDRRIPFQQLGLADAFSPPRPLATESGSGASTVFMEIERLAPWPPVIRRRGSVPMPARPFRHVE